MPIVFAFSPNPLGFIAYSPESNSWHGCPDDLKTQLKALSASGEDLHHVSIGSDGDWFLRTNRSNHWKAPTDGTRSQVVQFLEYAKASGLEIPPQSVNSFIFTPKGDGGICLIDRGYGVECLWQGVIPNSLQDYIVDARRSKVPVLSVSVGYGGSWVALLQNGAIKWEGIPQSLVDWLKSPAHGTIQSVSLSLVDKDHFFVMADDAAYSYNVSQSWASYVEAVCKKVEQKILSEMVAKINSTNLTNARLALQMSQNSLQNAVMVHETTRRGQESTMAALGGGEWKYVDNNGSFY